ncbi:hypothetical protein [Streptomyces sp. NPDC093544]|uniref:hypothetical protein n=1 Tax=Streptomyces sp. NPDC093544 TaxID=3155200 RepID=UPI00342568DF
MRGAAAAHPDHLRCSPDAAGRLTVATEQGKAIDGTWSTTSTTTNHYGCDCDSPAWTSSSGGVSRRCRRYRWSSLQRYDEYDNPLDGTAGTTYDWLDSYERDSGTLSGVTRMGGRLYDPSTAKGVTALSTRTPGAIYPTSRGP